jgi:hypothetical protein
MPQQGSLELLNDPVARTLLGSANPARLAYAWRDGGPRVVPIWFHWTAINWSLDRRQGRPRSGLRRRTRGC